QLAAQLVLGCLVVLRPCIAVLEWKLKRLRLAEPLGHAWIPLRRIREALPNLLPTIGALAKLPCGGDRAGPCRVEAQIRDALLGEGGPLLVAETLAVADRVVQPAKQDADRVGVDQVVEEVGIEDLLGEAFHSLIEQLIEGQEQRGGSRRTVGDGEAKASFGV